jgi:hypothetical protein
MIYIKADTVYRLGNYEYSLQWRDAPESTQYAALKFGAWMLELKGHLQDKINGKSKVHILLHNFSLPTHERNPNIQIADEIHPQCQFHPIISFYYINNNDNHRLHTTVPSRLFSDSSRLQRWSGPAWVLRSVSFHPYLFLTPTLNTRSYSSYTAVATEKTRHTSYASSGVARRW